MEPDVLLAIRELLSSSRVLALAVMVGDEPEAALLPYGLREDYGAVFVQASRLARHSRGLTEGATVGVLIHAADTPDADPMQIPRMSVRATVRVLEKLSDEYATAAARMIERFPGAKVTLALDDFSLYELVFFRGRYIEGFSRAFDIDAETFAEVKGL